ncbi:fermentation/respiration switch protein [Streptococcus constellatus]|uniref:Fermentation/respiration switch protein n=1 Tax=Streptococcus constellatus TaxID=76860 RepID=A0A564TYE5_STRCV|nr:alpha/beta fold hydrolase [Streptococcus constellatus]VUX02872.1 fermentation/respiration switch protein [Streptococcus gordonii]VUX12311.1 fermentation/respiration switch protein [Streptococcus constellatus]
MKKLKQKRIWTVIAGGVVAIAIAGGTYLYASQGDRSASNIITAQSSQGNSQINRQYQVETREIFYESNGNRIFGLARIPQGAGRVPTVIFAHGFGANHDQEELIQKSLASNGIAVYTIDFAGGTGDNGRSEGEMINMSVLTEQQNLQEALKIMKKQSFVDTNNIFLLGASQGGVVSSLTAVANSNQVRGVALLYPAFSLFDDAHERFRSESAIPNTYNLMGLTVGRRYFEDIWNIEIFNAISKYKGPVTIFHGTDDNIVPYSYAERASRTFPHATLTTVENAGHGFSASEQSQIANQLVDFVNNHKNN